MIYSRVSSIPAPAPGPLPQSCLLSRALPRAGFRDIQGTALGHPDLSCRATQTKNTSWELAGLELRMRVHPKINTWEAAKDFPTLGMRPSFILPAGSLPGTAFPWVGSHLVAKPPLCLWCAPVSCQRKGNSNKTQEHRWTVCTWKIPASPNSSREPHGGGEAPPGGSETAGSLCADNSRCLLGFPKNLFRAQSIGFLFPLPPRQIVRRRRKRIRCIQTLAVGENGF